MTTYSQDKEFLLSVIGDSLLEIAIEWIQKNMDPQDVFPDSALENWAENEGFTKE